MCAGKDLEPRAAKAEFTRISHRDPKNNNNVSFFEEIDILAGVGQFGTSSSSSCGAAQPSHGSTTSLSAATIP